MRPAVSVIVPNLNGGDRLLDLVAGLDSSPTPGDVQVIVVDNASTDGSASGVRRRCPSAIVVEHASNRGFAPACNTGASLASGRYLLFLNTDALLDATTLARLLHAAEQDDAAAVWQPVLQDEHGEVQSAGMRLMFPGFQCHERELPPGGCVRSVFAAAGACMLVRRDVFFSVGAFDDDFFAYFEEVDLCWRIRLAGWEVRVVADVAVVHEGGATTRRVLRPSVIYGLGYGNRLRSLLYNCGPAALVTIVPAHVAAGVAIAGAFVVRRRPAIALAILRALASAFARPRHVVQRRRRAQHVRTVGDREVLRNDLTVAMTPARISRLLGGTISRW